MLDTQLFTIKVQSFTDYIRTVYPAYFGRFTPQEWEDVLNFASEHIDAYDAEQNALYQYDNGYEDGRNDGYDRGYEYGYDEGYENAINEIHRLDNGV